MKTASPTCPEKKIALQNGGPMKVRSIPIHDYEISHPLEDTWLSWSMSPNSLISSLFWDIWYFLYFGSESQQKTTKIYSFSHFTEYLQFETFLDYFHFRLFRLRLSDIFKWGGHIWSLFRPPVLYIFGDCSEDSIFSKYRLYVERAIGCKSIETVDKRAMNYKSDSGEFAIGSVWTTI